MIVVLTGAPGAGKGTQADLLRDRLGYRKISTGDALRKHVAIGSPIGKKAAEIMESGRLVPDDVLAEILKLELGTLPSERILLDGYPRNVAQAEALAGISPVHRVAMAVQLDVEQALLTERLTGRRVCSKCGKSFHLSGKMPPDGRSCDACGGLLIQRPDDVLDKVKVRLDVYNRETRPVLSYYEQLGLFRRLDGGRSTEEVFAELKSLLEEV
jgi:adenylate kinase